MLLARRNVLLGIAALPAGTLLGVRPMRGLALTVFNGSELHTAFQAAGPGSSIVLAPGNYGDVGRFTLASSNVSVRVQSPLRTILRAPLEVRGDLVRLDGLAFEEWVHLAGGGLTVTNSSLRNGVEVSGIDTEIAYNEVASFVGRGLVVRASSRNCHVHHNHLHDGVTGGHNANAAIQIGLSMRDTNTPVSALVEYNLFERCTNGNETISCKSSYNTIRFNTVEDSKNFTNRHGENNLWVGNTFIRSYTITVHDNNNQVLGNRFVSSKGIRIMGGDHAPETPQQGGHPAANNTYLCGNEGTLQIGIQWPGDQLPATNTTVANHKGKIRLVAQVNTNLNGVPIEVPAAVIVTADQVGPRGQGPVDPPPPPPPPPGRRHTTGA